MPSREHSTPLEPGTRFVMPRMAFIHANEPGETCHIIKLYANASWLAEQLLDGKTRHELIHEIARREDERIPYSGRTTFSFSRVPSAMNPAYMVGETMLITVVWS